MRKVINVLLVKLRNLREANIVQFAIIVSRDLITIAFGLISVSVGKTINGF